MSSFGYGISTLTNKDKDKIVSINTLIRKLSVQKEYWLFLRENELEGMDDLIPVLAHLNL